MERFPLQSLTVFSFRWRKRYETWDWCLWSRFFGIFFFQKNYCVSSLERGKYGNAEISISGSQFLLTEGAQWCAQDFLQLLPQIWVEFCFYTSRRLKTLKSVAKLPALVLFFVLLFWLLNAQKVEIENFSYSLFYILFVPSIVHLPLVCVTNGAQNLKIFQKCPLGWTYFNSL